MSGMRFYDTGMKTYVEIKEEDGNAALYIKGIGIENSRQSLYPYQLYASDYYDKMYSGKADKTKEKRWLP